MREEFLLGNGAIALGLLEAGCQVVTSYPGTPSSEILPEVIRLMKSENLGTYVEWSTNEKVALDNAYAAAISGKRAACCMKQVGLNVAADSLLSAAYLGTTGGLVIISCDDPGPHSSQTEQDSRLMARFAKVPVFDPSTPAEARRMAALAMDISEEFKIPVILRPAIRVCHGRQNLAWDNLDPTEIKLFLKKIPPDGRPHPNSVTCSTVNSTENWKRFAADSKPSNPSTPITWNRIKATGWASLPAVFPMPWSRTSWLKKIAGTFPCLKSARPTLFPGNWLAFSWLPANMCWSLKKPIRSSSIF